MSCDNTTKVTTLDDLIARAKPEDTINVSNCILVEAAAELGAERRQRAVQACKGLIDNFTATLKNQVATLRQMRENEKHQAELVKKIDRAIKYFGVTGNPLPVFAASVSNNRNATYWCENCGLPVPKTDDPAWKVPDDFNAE